MISKIKSLFTFILASLFLLPGFKVSAASIFGRMNTVANPSYANVDEFSLSRMIGQAISAFIGLLGIIFVVLIIYAGYNWMTAAGDSGKVDKAKETLWRAVIGLVITVGAYAIWRWVFMAFI